MPSLARFGFISFAVIIAGLALMTVLAPAKSTEFGLQIERRISGLQVQRTEADGFRMPYLVGGNGETLVLLHGISANKDNFTRVARHLTPEFHVVIPDLPGFGNASAPPDADYSLSAQVRRIAAFLDALDLDRVHLGGSSMGGYIAAAFAAEYPDRVASLWLLAPAGLESAQEAPVRAAFRETGEIPLFAKTPEDYARVIDLVFVTPPSVPWFVRNTLAREAAERHQHYSNVFRQIHASPPLEPMLEKITAPALVVWGRQDMVLDASGAEVFQRLRPEATEIRLMDNIGHLPMLEDPATSARDFLAFQRRLR
jgi:pimeloyl-ACP methyl ester carboxylesterase